MTQLTQATPVITAEGMYGQVPCATAVKVYEGSVVGDNGSGYGRQLVAGDRFLGHAIEDVDNTNGADGAEDIKLLTGRYQLKVTLAVAITDRGLPVYASDGATYSLTPSTSSPVGKVVRYVDSTHAIVEFVAPAEMHLDVGAWSSATAGKGVPLLPTVRTAMTRINADDGGTALTAGSYRAGYGRTLITAAITGSPDLSIHGWQGHLKIAANVASGGTMAGLWGYVEVAAGKTVGAILAGVHAACEAPATAVVAAGAYLAGVNIKSNDINCTHTGKVVCINVEAPGAGAWDGLFNLPSALSGSSNGSGADVYIPILIGGVAARITAKYVA